jgi:hypothetical protein
LAGKPLRDVVSVVRFLYERFEFAFGVAAATGVDYRVSEAMTCIIDTAVVIALGGIGRKGEDTGGGALGVSRTIE